MNKKDLNNDCWERESLFNDLNKYLWSVKKNKTLEEFNSKSLFDWAEDKKESFCNFKL